jgi:hypothetical protein
VDAKLRTYHAEEYAPSNGRGFLTEPGTWQLHELREHKIEGVEDGGHLSRILASGLSYLAVQHWIGMIEQAVQAFIRDNQKSCEYCDGKWIVLEESDGGDFCPQCGSNQNSKKGPRG